MIDCRLTKLLEKGDFERLSNHPDIDIAYENDDIIEVDVVMYGNKLLEEKFLTEDDLEEVRMHDQWCGKRKIEFVAFIRND